MKNCELWLVVLLGEEKRKGKKRKGREKEKGRKERKQTTTLLIRRQERSPLN